MIPPKKVESRPQVLKVKKLAGTIFLGTKAWPFLSFSLRLKSRASFELRNLLEQTFFWQSVPSFATALQPHCCGSSGLVPPQPRRFGLGWSLAQCPVLVKEPEEKWLLSYAYLASPFALLMLIQNPLLIHWNHDFWNFFFSVSCDF